MSTAGATYKQDMPPPGGYNSINYKRVSTKTFFKGRTLFGGYLVITAGASYLFYLNWVAVRNRELEMRCANLALFPMLLAEKDRAFLKQVRKNRDEETKLMANVEGWKTGTWYGEPLFYTLDKNKFISPRLEEYYVHAKYQDQLLRENMKFLN